MSPLDPLASALADLDALEAAGLGAFGQARDADAVEAARIEFLGQKQGKVKAAQERLKSLEPAAKRAYGQRFNAVKQALEAACDAAKVRAARPAVEAGDAIDVTLPGHRPRLGHRHPLTQTADELIDLFGRFGFAVARGPEVEDVRHNFEALNIPPSHPARDPLDNFYLSDGTRCSAARPARCRSGSWSASRRRSASSPSAGSIAPTRSTRRTRSCSTRSRG